MKAFYRNRFGLRSSIRALGVESVATAGGSDLVRIAHRDDVVVVYVGSVLDDHFPLRISLPVPPEPGIARLPSPQVSTARYRSLLVAG